MVLIGTGVLAAATGVDEPGSWQTLAIFLALCAVLLGLEALVIRPTQVRRGLPPRRDGVGAANRALYPVLLAVSLLALVSAAVAGVVSLLV